jgi:hypothetical protein
VSRGNVNEGFNCLEATTLSNCTSVYNGQFGITNGYGSVTTNCTAFTNSNIGIVADTSVVRSNASTLNTGGQILATNSTEVDNR